MTMTQERSGVKVPTEKILSDDCIVHLGMVIEDGEVTNQGEEMFPHQGEWVEILTVGNIGEVIAVSKLQGLADRPTEESLIALGHHFEGLCHSLSQRVISWNWTSMLGLPMEQPMNRPDVLAGLTGEELVYLATLTASPMSAETRKKDSGSSDDTSSLNPQTEEPNP